MLVQMLLIRHRPKLFSLHTFFARFFLSSHLPRKTEIWDLLRTNFSRWNDGRLASNTVDDDFQRQKSLKIFWLPRDCLGKVRRVQSVSTESSEIVFHLRHIWLLTLVAINSTSHQRSFPSFSTLPSGVDVLCTDFDFKFETSLFVLMHHFYHGSLFSHIKTPSILPLPKIYKAWKPFDSQTKPVS